MEDLVGLFTSTALVTALWYRLNARINNQKRYKKHAKDPIRQVVKRTKAVCLILELEMPKKRDVYCYVSFLRY